MLERAQLVKKTRLGREVRVRGNVLALRRAAGLLDRMERIYRDRFDRIGDLVLTLDPGEDR